MRQLCWALIFCCVASPAWGQTNVLLNYQGPNNNPVQVSSPNPLPVTLSSGGTDACQSGTKITAAISQAGSGQIVAGTSAKKTYICGGSFNIADAESVSVVEGATSSTPCDTGTFALVGATTAANGMALSANEGVSMGTSAATNIAATHTAADNVCILQSGTGRLAGWVTYVQQ